MLDVDRTLQNQKESEELRGSTPRTAKSSKGAYMYGKHRSCATSSGLTVAKFTALLPMTGARCHAEQLGLHW